MDVHVRHGEVRAPAAEEFAIVFKQAAQKVMDGNPLFRKILLGAVLIQHPGRQDRDVGMGFHVHNHPAEQGRLEGNVRVHDQMVFALEMGKHRVVGTAEANV